MGSLVVKLGSSIVADSRGEVRAVDLVPAPTRLDRTVFLPPLPEETGIATAVP